jgi:D-sedoheptulose 7-phosphate isomerase
MLGISLNAQQYVARLQDELARVDLSALQRWSDLVFAAWQEKRTVFVIGNGGSATTATHICEDLGKSSIPESELHDDSRKRLKILSLTDNVGWLLALGNDVGYDQIFLQQLMNFAEPGDLLLAISGSGNSPNILKAVEWANRKDLTTFGLSGYDGGQLKKLQQDGLHVTLNDMGMVESLHLALFHWVLNDVFARINLQGRHQSHDMRPA